MFICYYVASTLIIKYHTLLAARKMQAVVRYRPGHFHGKEGVPSSNLGDGSTIIFTDQQMVGFLIPQGEIQAVFLLGAESEVLPQAGATAGIASNPIGLTKIMHGSQAMKQT